MIKTLTMILCTHKNKTQAERVVEELAYQRLRFLMKMSMRIVVVVHDKQYAPDNITGAFDLLVQPDLGWANSLDYAIRQTNNTWVGWVNDDTLFPDEEWFTKAIATLNVDDSIKLLGFNDGRMKGKCCSLGLMNREWYLSHFPDGQPYTHYALDSEIHALAVKEGVWNYAIGVVTPHDFDPSKVNRNFQQTDVKMFLSRGYKLL